MSLYEQHSTTTTTTWNYIMALNFEKNSKKENLKKIPWRDKYNTQTTEELRYEISLQQRRA
jgi:hypothetical protein